MVKRPPLGADKKLSSPGQGYALLERLETIHCSVIQQQNKQLVDAQTRKVQEMHSLRREVAALTETVDDLEKEGKMLMTTSRQLRQQLVDSDSRKKEVQNTCVLLAQRRRMRDPDDLLSRVLNEGVQKPAKGLKRGSTVLSMQDNLAAQAYAPESRAWQAEAREAGQTEEHSPTWFAMQSAEYAILGHTIVGEAQRAHMALRQLVVELTADMDDISPQMATPSEPSTENAALLAQLYHHGDARMMVSLVDQVIYFCNVQDLYQGARAILQSSRLKRPGQRLVGFKDYFLEAPPLQRPEVHVLVAIDGFICTIRCTQDAATAGSYAQIEAASRLNHGLLLGMRIGFGSHTASFLEAGAATGTLRAKHGLTALHLAASRGDATSVRALLENGHPGTSTDIFGRFAFHRALMKGHNDVAHLILASCLEESSLAKRTKPGSITNEHRSQLIELLCWTVSQSGIPREILIQLAQLLAAMFQNEEELTGGGPVLALLSKFMHSLCELADSQSQSFIVKCLQSFVESLQKVVVDIALNALDDKGWSPLDVAEYNQQHWLSSALRQAGPAYHSLHYLVTRPSVTDEELSRWPGWYKLEHEPDINVLNSQGDTPLLAAAAIGGPCRTLIERRADTTRRNGIGATALQVAKSFDSLAPDVLALLEKETGVLDHEMPLLHSAIAEGHDSHALQLIQSRPNRVHERDTTGRIALHIGARRCSITVVEALLRARSSVDAEDAYGNTPLSLAISGSNDLQSEMVWRLLLASRASPLKPNRDEVTPWSLAESLQMGASLQRAITGVRKATGLQAQQSVRLAEESQVKGKSTKSRRSTGGRRSTMNVLSALELAAKGFQSKDGATTNGDENSDEDPASPQTQTPLSPLSPRVPTKSSSGRAATADGDVRDPIPSSPAEREAPPDTTTEGGESWELDAMLRAQETAQLRLKQAKDQLHEELAAQQKETIEIRKQLATARSGPVESQLRQIQQWKAELNKMNRRSLHMKENLQKIEAEADSEFSRLGEQRQENENVVTRKEKLEKELIMRSIHNMKMNKKLQSESEAMESRRIEAKFLRSDAEKDVKNMESALSKTEKQIKVQEELKRKFQSEIASRDTELEEQKSTVAQLTARLAELSAEHNQLSQQVPSAEAKTVELRAAKETAQDLETRLIDLVLADTTQDSFKLVAKKLEVALEQAKEQSSLKPTVLHSVVLAHCLAVGKDRPKDPTESERDTTEEVNPADDQEQAADAEKEAATELQHAEQEREDSQQEHAQEQD
eukprot:gnl/MRDRNA2_/MRDRNA2_101317_c0_seq1.p1 gnl/MRDRNA2_/MRDRNA2_101317_c0~~gnl/MRDRNA2_/MRDRNA2_101317_c0_seq1.p1  ORF type:complete len:1262 (+),score=291.26 gnl/MRDRNA2_/MRDRNA2_101317_c0_seq1:84-3869(+)